MTLPLCALQPSPDLLVFAALAGIASLGAVGVVAFSSAVRSALCLVVNFFVLALLYFTLHAEMLGVTQIVVYTGAIMVLVLFVIMLLNLAAPQLLKERFDFKRPIGILMGFGLFAMLCAELLPGLVMLTRPGTTGVLDAYGGPHALGRALFTTYMFPFEVVSVLLLVGIVGSILLAKRKI